MDEEKKTTTTKKDPIRYEIKKKRKICIYSSLVVNFLFILF